jgi:uncharacterized membrane protein YtjA (UPF0391 family)
VVGGATVVDTIVDVLVGAGTLSTMITIVPDDAMLVAWPPGANRRGTRSTRTCRRSGGEDYARSSPILRRGPAGYTTAAMLHYAVVFFVIALIASVLGFGGIAGMSAQIGWIFAVVAVIFLAVAVLGGRGGRGSISLP